MSERGLALHVHGSPTADAITGAADALQEFVEGLGIPVAKVTLMMHCDTCHEQSRPLDADTLSAEIDTLVTEGWVRDVKAKTDTCPDCAALATDADGGKS